MRPGFVHFAGDLSGWPKGTTPAPTMLRRLDQYSSELVNGDEGGTWSPASPIVIGFAAGAAPTNAIRLRVEAGSQFIGTVETVRGNRDQQTPAKAGIVLTGSQGPAFVVEQSRTIWIPFNLWTESSETLGNGDLQIATPLYRLDRRLLCPRAVMPAKGNKKATTGCVPVPMRGNHRSATIDSVTFYYLIGSRPVELPTNQPRFRIIRTAQDANAVRMHTVASPYDSAGWRQEAAADVDAYFANGNVKGLTYVPNTSNDSNDPSQYTYSLQWRDDDANIPRGALGNAFLGATVSLSDISQLRSE